MIPHFSNDSTTIVQCHVGDRPLIGSSSSPVLEGPASKRQKGAGGSVQVDVSSHSHSTISTMSSSISSSSSFAAMPLVQQQQQEQQQQEDVVMTLEHKTRAPRRVSFAPVIDIYRSDKNKEEVNSCWYTKDELSLLKQDRKALVKVLKKARFDLSKIDQSVHCLRGYEAYLSIQANKEYKAKRQMAVQSVLREQARQRHGRCQDKMMMQLVSSHATQWARDTATELGMQDAQVALQLFLEYIREQEEEEGAEGEDLEDVIEGEEDDLNSSFFCFDEAELLEMSLPSSAQEEEDVNVTAIMRPALDTSASAQAAAKQQQHQQSQQPYTGWTNSRNNSPRRPVNLSSSEHSSTRNAV